MNKDSVGAYLELFYVCEIKSEQKIWNNIETFSLYPNVEVILIGKT